MAIEPFMLGGGRESNPWRQGFPHFGTQIRKDLVVEKGTIPSEKVPMSMDFPALKKNFVDFSQSWQSLTSHLS